MNTKAKLFSKLVKIMAEIDTIKKSGVNDAQGYQYMTEADILDALKPKLIELNLFIFSSSKFHSVQVLKKPDKYSKIEGATKETLVTNIETTHTFACGDTGETFEVTGVGSGWDEMDKGVYKAITGENKYTLSKNFKIASEDDPENDKANKSYARKTKPGAAKGYAGNKKTTKPTAQSVIKVNTGTAEQPAAKPSTTAPAIQVDKPAVTSPINLNGAADKPKLVAGGSRLDDVEF